MRKRKVIELNKILTEKLVQADNIIKEKDNDLVVSKDRISLLENKINDLQTEINRLLDEQKIFEEHFADFDFEEFENTSLQNTVDCVMDFTELEFIEESKICDNASMQEFAVANISKIVLETTKAQLSIMSSNLADKEILVEQLLGKTESAKIKIFAILEENLSEYDTKLKIEIQLNETINYINDLVSKILI